MAVESEDKAIDKDYSGKIIRAKLLIIRKKTRI